MNTIIDKKTEIARIIFTTEDEDIITKILQYTQKLLKAGVKHPRCYSGTEIRKSLKISVQQYKEGRVTPIEDVEKMFDK